MGRVLEHPTRRIARARDASHAVVERVLTGVSPQGGRTSGLTVRWPHPAKELELRRRLLQAWDAELRDGDLGTLGTEPLVAALRARADTLRCGPTAHALGTVRLVGLLRRTADALASRPT